MCVCITSSGLVRRYRSGINNWNTSIDRGANVGPPVIYIYTGIAGSIDN